MCEKLGSNLNEKGMALPMVLMICILISVIGIGIIGLSFNNLKMSSGERNYQSTYYIAESGITLMENQIEQASTAVCKNATTTSGFVNAIGNQSATFGAPYFSETNGKQPISTVNGVVQSKDAANGIVTLQIQSTGKIGNSERNLTKKIKVQCTCGSNGGSGNGNWGPPLSYLNDMAVYANNTVFINAIINGPIASNCGTGNCINSTPITFDWGADNKITNFSINAPNLPSPKTKIFTKPQYMNVSPTINQITARPFSGSSSPYLPPEFPAYPTLTKKANLLISGGTNQTISADGYYENITIQSDRTLFIDVGTTNRSIVVDNLIMEQGHIKLIGSGTLTLFVGNGFHFGDINKGISNGNGSSSINYQGTATRSAADRVKIYYKGTPELNLGGDIKINAHVYLKNVNKINMDGSGAIIGDIVAPEATIINVTGGANSLNHFILSPKATVNLNGGGTIIGSVICDKFNLTGGATIKHGSISDDDGYPSFYPPPSNNSSTGTISIIQEEPVRESK